MISEIHEKRATWRPLLSGALAERAAETLREIARCVGAGRAAALAGGSAGHAIFYRYLSRYQTDRGHEGTAVRLLDHSIEMLSEKPAISSLWDGFTGVAWAVAHLEGSLLEQGEDDPNEEIDDVLLAELKRSPWDGPYDLISGLVGTGVYALERLPRPTAVTCLERVVERLAETAISTQDGITWWTPPKWIWHETRHDYPRGYYNLGVAHGTPGVIALLGAACAAGVAVGVARPLLPRAVDWLLAQELGKDYAMRFPSYVYPDSKPAPSRLAWCYGDLGIAAVLMSAARGAEVRSWEDQAIRIARSSAARPFETARTIDASLCHGAAGNAHLFNRLHQATGDEELGRAAVEWYERTLQFRRPGEGAAGFLARVSDATGKPEWRPEKGMLNGIAGIGLVLLAALTGEDPAWDRTLIPALPGRARGTGPS
jgi:class I lanthipeptide synthase